MDLLSFPPEDQELKNIIDKLAQFVARNGFEFEAMTKQKQRDNPRFEFLFGGNYYNYYQFKLNSEREFLLRQQQQQQQQPRNHHEQQINHPPPQLPPPQIFSQQPPISAVIQQQQQQNQINELQDQIRQSLDNLNAQHQMLTNQQQLLIDDAICKIQDDNLMQSAHDFNINLTEFEILLHPVLEVCSKDSISSAKNWITTRCKQPAHYDIICKYFLKRTRSSGLQFEHKLHLLYLINDLFNHSIRKNIDSLKLALSSIVVPIYCFAYVGCDEENRNRLLKLEKIWESNQYLEPQIIEQLKNPQLSVTNYKQSLCNEYGSLVSPITAGTQAKINQLQQQHNDFVNHQNSKIQQLKVSSSLPPPQIVNTPQGQFLPPPTANHHPSSMQPPFHNQPPPSNVLSMLQQNPQMLGNPSIPPPNLTSIASNVNHGLQQHLVYVQSQNPIQQQPPPHQPTNLPNPNIINPHIFNHNAPMTNPHLQIQQPPPQIHGPPQPQQHSLQAQSQFPPQQPDVAYYELPAGLMVGLVKLEDFDYKELDSTAIRLPPPAPPNERLLKAVDEFYFSPAAAHDNNDGWNNLNLYEFYRAKAQAKNDLEDRLEMNKKSEYERTHRQTRSRSRSRSSKRRSSRYSSDSSRSSSSSSRSSRSSRSYSRSESSSRGRSSRKRSRSSSRQRYSSRSDSRSYSPKNR